MLLTYVVTLYHKTRTHLVELLCTRDVVTINVYIYVAMHALANLVSLCWEYSHFDHILIKAVTIGNFFNILTCNVVLSSYRKTKKFIFDVESNSLHVAKKPGKLEYYPCPNSQHLLSEI